MDFPVLLHVPIFSPRLLKCSHYAQLYFFSYHKLSNADGFSVKSNFHQLQGMAEIPLLIFHVLRSVFHSFYSAKIILRTKGLNFNAEYFDLISINHFVL